MTYAKPELVVLTYAVTAIQDPKQGGQDDINDKQLEPAYQDDE